MANKRIKDLATTKYKGFLPLDDDEGTGKFPINSLIESIAPVFDATVSYTARQLVMYEGKLYIFKVDHPAGAWNASHADVRNIAQYDLESIDFGKEKSTNLTATSGANLLVFNLFTLSLNVGDKYLIKLNESTNCVIEFAIGSLGDNGAWTRNSAYIPADNQWHEVEVTATNTYDGKCGIYIPADRVIANGTVSMEICTKYGTTLKFELSEAEKQIITLKNRLDLTQKKVDESSIEEITPETLTSATKTVTSGTNSLEFTLLDGALRTGEVYKIRMIDPSNAVSTFTLGSFGDNGAWTNNSAYVPADGDWHEVTITNGNSYNDKFGWLIPADRVIGNGSVTLEIQMNYENTLMYKVAKNTSDIANIQQSSLTKQFDGILKTDVSEPLTSVSESGGLAGIFPKFGFIGDSLCSGAVAYNDGTWNYPERYYTSWGLYMCREIGSSGTIWAYSGCSTETWWESYITQNARGVNDEGVQDDNERFSSTKIGYVIALGVNDIIASVTVGDVDTDIDLADYTNNADTFAGKYGRIIQKIKELQPSAKIFVVTIPTIWAGQAEAQGYNGVIRDMASKFTNVFVIDFYAYLPSGAQITSDYMYHGHMTTQGYKWIAMAMATYIDYIVRTTPASFKNVALIGHSSDHGQY